MSKRVYRAIAVKKVVLSKVLATLAEGPVVVGADIAKGEIVTMLRDSAGKFPAGWKTPQPGGLRTLVTLLRELAQHRPLTVALESTGTYGDPLRQALMDAGLVPQRVSGKAVKDYAEIFDGVPSNHDTKDAAIIAELAAQGKATPWPLTLAAESEDALAGWVDWLDAQQQIKQMWQGRLEALLARHWPEATQVLKLGSVTLQRALQHYGGPAGLAADPQAAARLKRWGRRYLEDEKIATLLATAQATVGVRMTVAEEEQLRRYAEQLQAAAQEIRRAKRELRKLAASHAAVQAQAAVVGVATACVLHVALGAAADYHSGGAYRKAMGLNLKERSSGRYQGQLKLTKRGPSRARRWLFFAALRVAQQAPVRGWFEAKKQRDGKGKGRKAVVAVMRKLALALHAVGARGAVFNPARLFPGHIKRKGREAA